MIKKERKIPLSIRKMEALLRRIPPNHPKIPEIKENLAKKKAGFRGEQSMDYFLKRLPIDDLFILHDLRILNGEYYFQIDTLIITPRFLLILEIKNYSGQLYFDEENTQLIRTLDGKEESFADPIYQVKRQASNLTEILELYKLPSIPIESLVVVSNPKTLVKKPNTHKESHKKVIKSFGLEDRFTEFKLKHKNVILEQKEMRKISRLLLKLDTSLNQDICSQYQILKCNLTKGVFCMDCDHSIMRRQKAKWVCSQCKAISKNAHLLALEDYRLLISDTITNEECRDFLKISSSFITYKILDSLSLPCTGSTKSRKYHLPT